MYACVSACDYMHLGEQYDMAVSAGSGPLWQQNTIQIIIKSFMTHSKLMIFWYNKKFLKA